jgi:glutamate/tyrosine decarboxylase-like PLP-dependent enzyme
MAFPSCGKPWDVVRRELVEAKQRDHDWLGGRLPLYIYYLDQDLLRAQCEAFNLYMVENGHGSKTVFPSLRQFEEDIIGMSLDLFHAADDQAAGSFTSGGTESIFLAAKAARDFARATRAVARPTIVAPATAHPAFDKASQYLDVRIRRVPVGRENRADVAAMSTAIDENTVMIVASAPAYPHGVFDPVSELAALAVQRGVWLHVDACFGGFLAPFAKDLGYAIPDFDFRLEGVTTLSADLHKYGFAPKGASVVLYRERRQHRYQTFEFRDWPRGVYTSPTFPGSRPAGSIAAAWAVMRYLGRDGYCRIARTIMDTKGRLERGIGSIAGLRALQPAELSILVYVSDDPAVDIDAVAAGLNERGWFVSRSVEPRGIHFTVNPVHAPVADDYLADLSAVVRDVRATGRKGVFEESTY